MSFIDIAENTIVTLPGTPSSTISATVLIAFRLKMGDHIAAYRPWTIIPIYHHGIYVGDGNVIDYCDDGSAERSFADFKDGCYVYVIIHPNPLDPSEIVKGARAALTEYKKKYHVLWNNCENFATAIVTGKGFSLQTERATGYIVFGGIAIATSLVLASLIPESKKQ